MEKKSNKAEINFKVNLDVNNVPERIFWDATDSDIKNNEAKAVLISIWDGLKKSSLKIDLWTKDMMAEEMQFFTFQILDALGDTYKKSVGDEKIANEIKDFAMHIGKKSNVLKKKI
ncbi:MAG: gliding motility protein GldC [Flavobacteriales bacterium]|jgi:gliding motility-associated protein GldC|nr:gliding motility protein GldC [Flavobacteriales bacterium]|tara:strand:- start:331 stop:678 length:348 start_codon:yes stop_codon:yes gene_type:complete